MASRECVHLLTRGHFRSPDKDGGHTIRSAVVEKPHDATLMAPSFIEPELYEIEIFIAGIRFWTFSATVTLILTR